MRQIGLLPLEADARRFAAYLTAEGLTAHAEPEGSGWAVWVREENDVPRARDELSHYRTEPQAARYRDAETKAGAALREAQQKREQARRNVIEMRGRWGRGGVGAGRRAPLTALLIAASVLVSILTSLGAAQDGAVFRLLSFVDPGAPVTDDAAGGGADQGSSSPFGGGWEAPTGARLHAALRDVLRGQVWRLLTPTLLHFGIMHLVFNCYGLWVLGAQVEDRRGAGRWALLVLTVALLSNVAQAWIEDAHFGGMSGVVYGLFGYVWMKSLYEPGSGMYVSTWTVVLMIGWFFYGLSGFAGPIANTCHGVGLAVGVVWGYLPQLRARK